jgi:predicted TIM-barrel fold metal-dependent hydrolase
MHTRRQFLRHSALSATVLGALPALLRSQPTATELPVPRAPGAAPATGLIDLHSHWFSPRSIEFLRARQGFPRFSVNEKGEKFLDRGPSAAAGGGGQGGARFPLGSQWFDIEARVRHLEENGVSRQLVSWPTTLNVDPSLSGEEARQLWGEYNEDLAGVISRHGDRLSGVAALASGDVAWSARELARAHDELGLIGGVLPVNGFDTLEGAQAFAPIFAAAQKYKSHIYLHTGYANAKIPGQPPLARHPDSASARAALDNIWNFTAATITLAFSGFLDDYPDVTVQVAQLGGAGGIGLVAEAVQLGADRSGVTDINARFRQIYLDTGAGGRGPEAIALATKVFGAERIVFGTDYAPQASVVPVIENIRKSPITDEDRQKIFTTNARQLLAAKGVAV